MKLDYKKREYVITALVVSALVLLAAASSLFYTRLDLTSSREFTLSAVARSLHEEIPETVRITYYISPNLAERHPGAQSIEDFLREFEALGKGSIRVRIANAEKEAEQAESFGIAPQQMQIVEKNEQRVALVYTGLVIEYLDDFFTIPALLSTSTLEYELIKAIRGLIYDSKQVAGLLIGDTGMTAENNFNILLRSLAQAGYEPRLIERSQKIESDVDVLFVLGNSALDRYDAWFVDDYMHRGGRAFFAVRGVSIDLEQGLQAKAVENDGILGLLSAYGVKISRQLVLDETNLTVPFQTSNYRGGYTIQYVRYPHWVSVQKRFVNAEHPITNNFSGLNLFWPSPLDVDKNTSVNFTTLASTTPVAWRQTSGFVTAPPANPQDVASYQLEKPDTGGTYPLAVAASGPITSPYAAGDLPVREGAEPLTAIPDVAADTRFVVVSSADFLTDLMQFSQSEFNAGFAVSAADWLASAEDLIAIRTRSERDLRLNKIADQNVKDATIILTYIVCIGLVPLFLVAWALVRAHARNRKEQQSRPLRGGEA
ncbi:MAG: GldG family protein [Spirochaetes bacterium]|nr:GldG family protein [Spirochaetota bacterium]MBU0955499.1 GldG family protein [Spirochaetota bacterium]